MLLAQMLLQQMFYNNWDISYNSTKMPFLKLLLEQML